MVALAFGRRCTLEGGRLLVENKYAAIAAVVGFVLTPVADRRQHDRRIWRPSADRRDWVGGSAAPKLIRLICWHSDQPMIATRTETRTIGEVESHVRQSRARGIRPCRANWRRELPTRTCRGNVGPQSIGVAFARSQMMLGLIAVGYSRDLSASCAQ
jgi:hypothetical protein